MRPRLPMIISVAVVTALAAAAQTPVLGAAAPEAPPSPFPLNTLPDTE